jgi:NADH-quinone oxidoreductase subunit C
LPSADQETETEGSAGASEEQADTEVDEARSSLLEALSEELGDSLEGSHLIAGRDLWVRVANDAWTQTADYLRNRQRFRFLGWLSAIDWKQSPFGRSHEASVDEVAAASSGDDTKEQAEGGYTGTGADGITGGSTRFQVLARVHNLSTGLGLNLKADVGEPMTVGTWIHTYPGADWHEREAHEMFGITFTGNPDMRNLYLPTDFEGYPLRKDFPLMARLVKPWPGIVDVEPMPPLSDDSEESPVANTVSAGAETAGQAQGAATTNPEDAS